MPLILGTNSIKDTGYDVANSLRFNAGSSDSLTKTFGTPTNNKIWTYSFWMKHCDNAGVLLNTGADTSYMYFRGSGANPTPFGFSIEQYVGGFQYKFIPNQVFRDHSAWQHIVIAFDTTQGTASNRVKIYKNGVQITSFNSADYPSQNLNTQVNSAVAHKIGGFASGANYDGYLCEVVFIDGQQLDPTSFGEFDEDSGIWKPIDVSGLTFGTNGFYLEFKQSGTGTNASGIGADTSGNTNHFAVNNLTAVSQSTDTCTNNFATMNPLNVPTSNAPTFAEGNLKTTSGTTGQAYMGSATIGVSSGKWYAEMKVKVIDSMIAGVSANVAEDARDSTYPGQQDDSVGILPDSGNKYISDSGSTHGDAFSADDVLMIALDLDNNNVYFGRNGNWFDGSGNADESSPNSAISLTAAASTTDGFYFFSVGDGGGSEAAAAEWNFGSPMYAISSGNTDANGHGNFEYAVPSGYFALCTKNLAEYG